MRQAGSGKAICLHVCRSLGVVKATRISGDSGAPPPCGLSLPPPNLYKHTNASCLFPHLISPPTPSPRSHSGRPGHRNRDTPR